MDLRKRWFDAWRALGLAGDPDLLQEVLHRYSDARRKYHTLQHLEECNGKLDELSGIAEHPAEVELALWFHDSIYEPRRSDNEQRSADWARESLLAAGAAPDVAERVHALIMATRHAVEPRGIDQQVLIDVDLAILGADSQRFDEYETQVREEYRWVPELIYRRKRAEILRSFLERPTIYSTPLFVERYEKQARANLARR